mgnify:FL=1
MKQKNLTLDAFKKIYAEWQASDTTIREFCRTICFDEDKFYFWKKKLLDSRNASSAGFIPVSMSQRNGKISISSPSAARTSPQDCSPLCEIIYQNGVVIRINREMTLDMLRSLILLCQ